MFRLQGLGTVLNKLDDALQVEEFLEDDYDIEDIRKQIAVVYRTNNCQLGEIPNKLYIINNYKIVEYEFIPEQTLGLSLTESMCIYRETCIVAQYNSVNDNNIIEEKYNMYNMIYSNSSDGLTNEQLDELLDGLIKSL